MTTNWRTTFKAAAGIAMTALVVTACSSSKSGPAVGTAAPLAAPSSAAGSAAAASSAVSGSGAASPSSAPPAGSSAAAGGAVATIKTTSSKAGTYLVDGAGRALYLWVADTSSTSTCTGQCATFWPPLLTSAPATASGGATASLLGTTKRADGTTQVTYAGHPLYYFLKDTTAGMTTGQGNNGFGAKWWLVTPAGSAITVAAAAAKPSTAAAKPPTAAPKASTTASTVTAPSPPAPSLPSPSY